MKDEYDDEHGQALPDDEEERYNALAARGGHLTSEQLSAIDLSWYDQLVTVPVVANPVNIDVSLEHKKILFLQTAVRLGVPYHLVVKDTLPHFGNPLTPFVLDAAVTLWEPEPFEWPAFDVSRQTPGDWAAAADKAYKKRRDAIVGELSEWRNSQIKQGILKAVERHRQNSRAVAGPGKAAIADERMTFEWAVVYFFAADSWTDLANTFPDNSIHPRNPLEAAQQRRKRADQIRKRVLLVLKELGLPVRK